MKESRARRIAAFTQFCHKIRLPVGTSASEWIIERNFANSPPFENLSLNPSKCAEISAKSAFWKTTFSH